jgi:hypothetical protein
MEQARHFMNVYIIYFYAVFYGSEEENLIYWTKKKTREKRPKLTYIHTEHISSTNGSSWLDVIVGLRRLIYIQLYNILYIYPVLYVSFGRFSLVFLLFNISNFPLLNHKKQHRKEQPTTMWWMQSFSSLSVTDALAIKLGLCLYLFY